MDKWADWCVDVDDRQREKSKQGKGFNAEVTEGSARSSRRGMGEISEVAYAVIVAP